MNLEIIRGSSESYEPSQSAKVINYEEFKEWIRTGKIYIKLFRYSNVILITDNLEKFYWTLPITIIMKMISRGECLIKDSNASQLITIRYLLTQIKHYTMKETR